MWLKQTEEADYAHRILHENNQKRTCIRDLFFPARGADVKLTLHQLTIYPVLSRMTHPGRGDEDSEQIESKLQSC